MTKVEYTAQDVERLVQRGRVERALFFRSVFRRAVAGVKKTFANHSPSPLPQTGR